MKIGVKVAKEHILLRKFADRVRLKRCELKLSQEKLAELVNCHPNSIGRIERAQADPSLKMILKIALALNVSPKDIMPD